jgi:hypothetical protein
MLHPEYAIIGSIDAYTSSQAAIEARRSLAHEEEQSRGLR